MVRRVFLSLVLAAVLFVVPAFAYEDIPPDNAPFTGSCYITCDTRSLGVVDVFIPVSFREGFLGSNNDGGFFNVSNSSISGVLYTQNGTEYQFRCSSWAAPQYRQNSGNSYTYFDLEVTDILSSNVLIAEEFPPLVSASTIFPYAYLMVGGVIVLCLFLKRF